MKGKVKVVFFDYGGVLTPGISETFHAFAEPFQKSRGINPAEHDRAWKKVKRLASSGKISFGEAQARTFKALGKTRKDARNWVKHCERYHLTRAKPYPGVVETLARLKREGFKTAVLSDSVYSATFKKRILKRWGARVDAVYCSSEIGVEKPARKAFQAVLRRFNAKPCEAVFIGHAKDELDGARKLGIKTIAFRPDKGAHGDFETNDFKKILKIIQLRDSCSTA